MLLKREGISQELYDNVLNELNIQEAEIQIIKAQITKTEIHAPFDGAIGLKSVSEGSFISPDTKVASLQNLSFLKIDFSIPEKYSNLIKTGSPVTFTIQGDNKKYSASVYAIEPKIDPVSRTLQIRAITKNSNSRLRPGSFAKVELILQTIPEAIMIPTEALWQDIKGARVYVNNNSKAQLKPVELGIRKDKTIQITKGLSIGDTVITTGLMQIKQGVPVKIVLISNDK